MTDALRRHRRFLMGLFIAAAAFLYLGHIGSYHLIDLDEGRYHRVAMEMVLSGDYITPHFDYMPYFEKPIFQYWVTALSMELFGIREFTGRILPALTGLGNVFLAFWLVQPAHRPPGCRHLGYVGAAAHRRLYRRHGHGPDLFHRRLPGLVLHL